MTIHKVPESYIERKLVAVPAHGRPGVRLAIDLAALLIGPTCGGEADRLVALLRASTDDPEIVRTLREIADRYDPVGATHTLYLPEEGEEALIGKRIAIDGADFDVVEDPCVPPRPNRMTTVLLRPVTR
jgi:hypothetical protein